MRAACLHRERARLSNWLDNAGDAMSNSLGLDPRLGFGLGVLDLRALRGPYQTSGGQKCSPDLFLEVQHGAAITSLH